MSAPALTTDFGKLERTQKLERPRVRGKFLFVGDQKLYICGVTYGPFGPAGDKTEYPEPAQVAADFAKMAANGINAVRTYSVPPIWLLDFAEKAGIRVMVGLPWEQHITFLDDPQTVRSIEERVRTAVRQCAGHGALLCYAVGNEIPAGIVRWLGRQRVERFIERLYRAAKAEDPSALFTYVNFPTTEFLDLHFLDLFCFNVYLESRESFEAYLARLQNLAGNRPLLMAEIGLDSQRNGEETQARSLEWQVRSAFAGGGAGTFVFAWTDEWHRGGLEITDWDFGLTRRDRTEKPALQAVRQVYSEVPFASNIQWPKISVVVCTYNGARRLLEECFDHLQKLDYPNYEVIVVDDGSTHRFTACAIDHGFRLIRTHNAGLSHARNTGLHAATGEIVAYIDDDAYPDTDWLKFLAATFLRGEFVAVGGPNIPPPGDGWIADCVSNSPGGPIQVLLSDREAEHIPGCNMAYLKSALLEIGGFDERFRVAGDDVDVCWSLQQRGWKLGFHPSAVVWHHRRNSLRTYWRQQRGYGRAEALLEKKWPQKYNGAGHVSWAGRVYGNGFSTLFPNAGRIYQGPWGTAPFQRLYEQTPGMFASLILMPEWYLIVGLLGLLTALSVSWRPLLLAAPLLVLALAAPLAHAIVSGWRARFATPPSSKLAEMVRRGTTALLHLAQPLARLLGRVHWGLTPWRGMHDGRPSIPRSISFAIWTETWQSIEDRLHALESSIKDRGAVVHRNGDFDRWDLEIRGGLLACARVRMAIEEHGQGRQLTRLQVSPCFSFFAFWLTLPLVALATAAGLEHAWIACGVMSVLALLLMLCCVRECESAMATVLAATGLDVEPAATAAGECREISSSHPGGEMMQSVAASPQAARAAQVQEKSA